MSGTDIAAIIGSLAFLVTAIAGAVVSIVTVFRTSHVVEAVRTEVSNVHAEVKTANGITMAALADRAEGRRIDADILPEDQTKSEAKYVELLNEGEHP